MKRGLALGLSVPVIKSAFASHAFAQATPGASPVASNVVPIVGREMTADEIKAAIEAEGEVTVGNWTYTANRSARPTVPGLRQQTYGVEHHAQLRGSQTPSTYLTDIYTAVRRRAIDSPYDVLAIEENYWAQDADKMPQTQGTKLIEDFLPSPLIPNAERVMDSLKHVPTAIGFQASASPGINYNSDNVDLMTDWKDLADERLKGKLLMWLPGDITGGGILLGMSASLGTDYKNPDHMNQTIQFLVESVHPNAVKYTSRLRRSAGALQQWRGRRRHLLELACPAQLPERSGGCRIPRRRFRAIRGQRLLFIPVKPQHPVLAQIFIDWRLSDDAQFPDIDSWGITKGGWAELHEGFIGPSYEGLVPEWIAADYFKYFPTIEQLATNYKSIDWEYYAANSAAWYDQWLQGIGL